MSLKDLIADVNVNEICEHIETETLSEWVNVWQEAALSALRPVSREQVEKVQAIWNFVGTANDNDIYRCSNCGNISEDCTRFCPSCGAPMTDEAVDMVMERMEAIFSARNDD